MIESAGQVVGLARELADRSSVSCRKVRLRHEWNGFVTGAGRGLVVGRECLCAAECRRAAEEVGAPEVGAVQLRGFAPCWSRGPEHVDEQRPELVGVLGQRADAADRKSVV